MNICFVDREAELAELERLYTQPGAQLVVVYGRRRLGKTALLKQFAEGKPAVYYMADRGGVQSQRDAMARAMGVCLDEPLLATAHFPDWYALFEAFDRVRPADAKLVLMIDEYQYLCQAEKAFSSYVQKWWDEHWQRDSILIVLCGSVTSMMYRETLASASPLYGRSAGHILLRPIPFQHIQSFCEDATQEALVERYALCGGVPRYLELLGTFPSLEVGLREGVVNPLSPLYREARNLLMDEVDVPNTCWSMLEAIAGGARRISEIASRLKLPANQLTRYLDLLRDLYIVRREVPVLEKNPGKSKKGIYVMTDAFLALWFGCIYPYESLFEFGRVDEGLARVRPLLDRHIEATFEALCRDYVREHVADFDCVRVGRQWGAHYEIDVAGVNRNGSLGVAGACKWSTRKVGLSVLRGLERTVSQQGLVTSRRLQWILFSRSGFSEDLEQAARTREDLRLVYNIFE